MLILTLVFYKVIYTPAAAYAEAYLAGDNSSAERDEVASNGLTADGNLSLEEIKRTLLSTEEAANSRKYWPPEAFDTAVAVAFAESTVQHTEKDGTVKHNPDIKSVTGFYQIYVDKHGAELKQLGLDAEKFEDNVQFASILYKREGLTPWEDSRPTWEKLIKGGTLSPQEIPPSWVEVKSPGGEGGPASRRTRRTGRARTRGT